MKKETEQKLLDAIEYCNENDKNTEFMLQYMQDIAGVNFDCIIKFLEKTRKRLEREQQNGTIN